MSFPIAIGGKREEIEIIHSIAHTNQFTQYYGDNTKEDKV
jgi:hypothetical protein